MGILKSAAIRESKLVLLSAAGLALAVVGRTGDGNGDESLNEAV